MKIKATVDLCKKRGYFCLFTSEGGEQWLGDGHAFYNLGDLPKLDEDTLCTIFDIPEKARNKMVFRVDVIPDAVCFDDVTDEEVYCEQGPLVLGDGKNGVIPYKTSQGIQFIDRKHMAPLEDCGTVEVYERISRGGKSYFAIKRGYSLIALILPYTMITEPFVKNLKSLADLCEVALQIQKMAAGEEQLRYEDDDG